MTSLDGRVAVVTGGSSGIGLATVRRLNAEGAQVVTGDLSPFPDNDVEGVMAVSVDLSTKSGCDALVSAAASVHDRVDILVNNVGAAPTRAGFTTVRDEEWLGSWNLNLMSAVRTTRACISLLRKSPHGSIVSICSTTAWLPEPAWVDYAATKAALLVVSRALAEELGPEGIRVNAVSPGSIRTPLWDRPGGFADDLAKRYDTDRESAIKRYITEERRILLGSAGRAEDVAAAVAFLASADAAHITGSELSVHGGLIKTI